MSRQVLLLGFAAMIVVALISLGNWQLRRADEKEVLLERYATARHAQPQVVTDVSQLEGLERFTRVQLSGHFDTAHVVLLDNQVHEGRAGVHVLVPLEPSGAEAVLVNLGWLPLDDRSVPPEPELPTERVTVTGLVNLPPDVGMRLGAPSQGTWPLLTPYLDIAELNAVLEQQLAERVIWADPDPAGPWVRVWRITSFPPSRHRAYAFQWYSLAAGFSLACAILWWRQRRLGS